ncbi:MAG: trehalose-phosphatase [Anaerolineae bacterium]|nr:trehalose-phosphatase [Gemmatimonadaceae bacterium]
MTQPLMPVADAVALRLAGSPLVVMLDVDGTLAPIEQRPTDAKVPTETRRAVSALAAADGTVIVLVSGRAAADARRIVGVANVWIVGNHGYEIIGPEGETLIDPQVEAYQPVIAQAGRRIQPRLADVPGVIFEDKGWTLTVHYRMADPALVPKVRAALEETVSALGLRLTEGKMVFEVRPPAQINKGTAVLTLGRNLGGLSDEGALVFIGDDLSDEDAFRALRSRGKAPVTVRVSEDESAATAAEFRVRDTSDVRAFLEWLPSARQRPVRR